MGLRAQFGDLAHDLIPQCVAGTLACWEQELTVGGRVGFDIAALIAHGADEDRETLRLG
jgi:hypothetical protein